MQAGSETGATGLEPATSGVTGRRRPSSGLRATAAGAGEGVSASLHGGRGRVGSGAPGVGPLLGSDASGSRNARLGLLSTILGERNTVVNGWLISSANRRSDSQHTRTRRQGWWTATRPNVLPWPAEREVAAVCRSRSRQTGPTRSWLRCRSGSIRSLSTRSSACTRRGRPGPRLRLASIPDSFGGRSVLDVGASTASTASSPRRRQHGSSPSITSNTFIGCETVATELEGGEGFAAIRSAELQGRVSTHRRLAIDDMAERFDFIFCFGILHRVENPFELLQSSPDGLTRTAGS